MEAGDAGAALAGGSCQVTRALGAAAGSASASGDALGTSAGALAGAVTAVALGGSSTDALAGACAGVPTAGCSDPFRVGGGGAAMDTAMLGAEIGSVFACGVATPVGGGK